MLVILIEPRVIQSWPVGFMWSLCSNCNIIYFAETLYNHRVQIDKEDINLEILDTANDVSV